MFVHVLINLCFLLQAKSVEGDKRKITRGSDWALQVRVSLCHMCRSLFWLVIFKLLLAVLEVVVTNELAILELRH